MRYERLRREVVEVLMGFAANDLGSWTSGNVSVRDEETRNIAIKPSGIRAGLVRPRDIAVLSPDGSEIDAPLRPSSDATSHLYIYRNLPQVMAIVHTHSPFATAFAATGKTIPFCLTEMADITRWPIPCIKYVMPGGDGIGRAIVENIGEAPAALLGNHGVITVGRSAAAAMDAAVILEHAARVTWLAMQIGDPMLLPCNDIDMVYDYHRTAYGQSGGEQRQKWVT